MDSTTTTTVSDNIAYLQECWNNMADWMNNKRKRQQYLKMLNLLQRQIDTGFYITEEEELFLLQTIHIVESA